MAALARVLPEAERVRPVENADRSSLGALCASLFDALGPLHRLTGHDAETLAVAAGAMPASTTARPLSPTDAKVIDAALDLAAEAMPDAWRGMPTRLPTCELRRTVWIAAILRLATAVTWECAEVSDIYVAWTNSVLHIDLEAPALTSSGRERVRNRGAALESVTERRLLLTTRHGVTQATSADVVVLDGAA